MQSILVLVLLILHFPLCAMHRPYKGCPNKKATTQQLKELLNNFHPDMRLPTAQIMTLVVADADPNAISDEGYYAGCSWLHALVPKAYITAYLDLIKFLLFHGADPDIQDTHGRTAFLLSMVEGHYNLALMLHKDTLDINIPDDSGNTFLHQLVLRGEVKLIQLWLAKGAFVSLGTCNKRGEMPMDITPLKNAAAVKMLVRPQKIL